jgi:hypothetical protein
MLDLFDLAYIDAQKAAGAAAWAQISDAARMAAIAAQVRKFASERLEDSSLSGDYRAHRAAAA